jgi:hypothetical protein
MAARKMRVDHSIAGQVYWRDAVTGEPLLACAIPLTDLEPCDEAIYRYGVTQIVQDGGAVSADASFSDKLRGMKERIAAIEGGTYRLGQRGGMVDSDVFAAMVALGMITDTPDNRGKWREAKKSQRDAIRRKPAVAQWIAEHATDTEAAADAVDSIFA